MPQNNDADRQAILKKVNFLSAVFKNPQRELFESIFTKDCDYITFTGEHIKGVKENYKLHLQLVSLWIMKGASLEVKVKDIKFLSDTTAVVIAVGGIRFRWQKTLPKKRLSINTNVFVKEQGEWRIATFQNTRVKPMGFILRMFAKKK